MDECFCCRTPITNSAFEKGDYERGRLSKLVPWEWFKRHGHFGGYGDHPPRMAQRRVSLCAGCAHPEEVHFRTLPGDDPECGEKFHVGVTRRVAADIAAGRRREREKTRSRMTTSSCFCCDRRLVISAGPDQSYFSEFVLYEILPCRWIFANWRAYYPDYASMVWWRACLCRSCLYPTRTWFRTTSEGDKFHVGVTRRVAARMTLERLRRRERDEWGALKKDLVSRVKDERLAERLRRQGERQAREVKLQEIRKCRSLAKQLAGALKRSDLAALPSLAEEFTRLTNSPPS